MKKILMGLVAVMAMFAFTACGSSGDSKKDETVKEFSLIGAIDCRGISELGGEVKLRAKVDYNDNIKRDSFTYEYSVDGETVDFETPIVSLTADGSAYLLDGDMYIQSNESNNQITHVFDLSYLDGGYRRLYRGACVQGKYVSVVNNNESNTSN